MKVRVWTQLSVVDYRNRHSLRTQLSQYCSILPQVRLSTGCSLYTYPLVESDEESSLKHVFFFALEYAVYKQFSQCIVAKLDCFCVCPLQHGMKENA